MIAARIDPGPWEQLGGYLLRIAGLMQCPPRDLLLAAGAAVRPGHSLQGLSGFPAADVTLPIAELLGVEARVIEQMTLARFRTGLCGREHRPGTAGATSDAPALLSGGVYCGVCVDEGRWDLRWKTGLTAVCVTHRRYVFARCPVCAKSVSPDSVWPRQDGDSSEVRHGTSEISSCDHATDVSGERPEVRALYAQEQVNRLLDMAVESTDAAASCRDVLRWMEYLHRCTAERTYLAGNFVAVDGPALGALLADALELTRSGTPGTHPILLRGVQQQRARGRGPQTPPRYEPLHADRPDQIAAAITEACASGDEPLVIPSPGAEQRRAGMPQVVPISEFTPDLSDDLHHLGYDRARLVVALSVAAPAGKPSWPRIGASLGVPEHVARPAGRALAYVRDTGQADTYWAAIARVRRTLTSTRIDFADRAVLVEHDPRVLAAATARWPALADQPTFAVRQWLMDRWACQYVQTLPASIVPRTHKAPDYRDTVDAAVGDADTIATLWKRWDPFAAPGSVRRAAA